MRMTTPGRVPVITGVRYFLAHTPGLVRYGHKPSLDIARSAAATEDIAGHLRSFSDAVAYPPNRAFLGSIYPDDLRDMSRPWFLQNGAAERRQPFGDIMPEEEFLALLKMADDFDIVWLTEDFAREATRALQDSPLIRPEDLEKLTESHSHSAVEERVASGASLPLTLKEGRLVGCVTGAEESDELGSEVLLENLACKATAAMALRTLLHDGGFDPAQVQYVLNTGEEAVGDSFQRGGGNMAKAVGEMCGLAGATGSDIKAFCCAPTHALVIAGSLVSSGLYDRVAVVGGCSLAKLGMNYRGHVDADQPVLEDVLAAFAVMVEPDDGGSPVIRLDAVGGHNIGAGSSLRAISRTLMTDPLAKVGLRFLDIDKFAIELQNPEITEPAGVGDVTERNYRVIAGLAVQNHEIERSDISDFSARHGMPGFSSTQGHIASAVPFLGHAVQRIGSGDMLRAMFVAKGSLFLGRMTQMSDGFSFILERNPAR
ncbi:MAG: glycine reductase [Chloroflexi bacterium]|nr:glycine reductase [Chloroflexota bacterium]